MYKQLSAVNTKLYNSEGELGTFFQIGKSPALSIIVQYYTYCRVVCTTI